MKNGNTSEELTLKNLSKNLGFTDKKKYQKNPELYKGVVFQFYKTLRLLLTHQEHGISIDDVVGITIMFENELLVNEVASKINDLLQKYNKSLPLYDKHFNQIQIENIHSL